MPRRFQLIDWEPWRGMGIHRVPINNFLVYYRIVDAEKEVWVTAVSYNKRNQFAMLMNMPLQ